MTETRLASYLDLDSVDIAAEVDWNALPEGLRELKETLGPEAAWTISSSLGGANLYVPLRPLPGSPLVRRLGSELARRMSRHYGGLNLSIPKPDAIYRQFRLKALRQRRASGLSLTQLALDFGLSRRRVMQLLTE